MSGYLIDTNVVSELRKGSRGSSAVRAWAEALAADEIYLSVITLAEIRKGIARLESRDADQASKLERWRHHLEQEYSRFERLLPIDAPVAKKWGDLQGVRPVPVIDCLLAATAAIHNLTFATRNTADIAGLGIAVVNPFEGL